MFSYRHAFHAGNHADVLKHTALLAVMRYLTIKETALQIVDTHAGAGLYRLDGDHAQTSAEAQDGFLRLLQAPAALPAGLQDYVDMVASFNTAGQWNVYPGSPFIVQRTLRLQDHLKLCELHPTDGKALSTNIAQLDAGKQIMVLREDGFPAVKRFMPPPSRRGLLLVDPSYELKPDYHRVHELISDCMVRFATGTYMVWYPIVPRSEAHDLPKRLRTLATKAGKPWVHATLTVKSNKLVGNDNMPSGGLPASGVVVINPPHTLKATLKECLPVMVKLLKQDSNAAYTLEGT
ncbi:23S rRNA (adenine(2030)-N(6))-methyltransferase RlmJ [Curvibacter sp. CHRR-16]|uniref:23S rRNA (adenine(2030)-N(6))-methyltransferase RlmJ n=1 Tax=Curvibacter sp. CHRR-16 TaxID=2835872 RepID=UPI001BD93A22|nr:23S rRNA (adenine(2030)-N(6))-methyltransferase RlmJ [Curvibacter sp. CHRR-16]MBT0569895.1 23S rRNA (adenine(2030)-N(6))-methyltransferase RlmJ [Curvibacter sp. CHRR-16]